MTVQQEPRDKRQHQCDDIFKVFLTLKPTSSISLELPEVGKLVKLQEKSNDREESFKALLEDWVALNFCIRTLIK